MDALEKNLAAIDAWLPDIGRRLRAATPDPDFLPVPGSDGTPTYRRTLDPPSHAPASGKRWDWLGGTSMPRASAAAIVASLDAGSGNGLGLGIGAGFEWKAFARRLAGHQMVFVYEPEPALARMALDVCDLSDELAAGKIVLITGPSADAADALCDFLNQNLGFEPPTVLHPLATLGLRRNGLLPVGEQLVRRAVAARHALLSRLATLVRGGDGVAAFLVRERYPGERPLHATIAGPDDPAHQHRIRLDRHDQTSAALRLKILGDVRAGRVVSDLFRAQLGGDGGMPEGIIVETWVPPGVGAGYWERVPRSETAGPHDRVVVHGEFHAMLLRERGYAPGRIEVRRLPLHKSPAPGKTGPRVAILGDLARIDAQAVGLTLPTHHAVYAAARAIVEEEYLSVHDGRAVDIVRRALEPAHVPAETLKDPSLAEAMAKLVRMVLIPNAPLLRLAAEMERWGVDVVRVGEWPEAGPAAGWPTDQGAIWDGVGRIAHLSPTGMVLPGVLDAARNGVAVVAVEHPTDDRAGSITDLLPDVRRVKPAKLMDVIRAQR